MKHRDTWSIRDEFSMSRKGPSKSLCVRLPDSLILCLQQNECTRDDGSVIEYEHDLPSYINLSNWDKVEKEELLLGATKLDLTDSCIENSFLEALSHSKTIVTFWAQQCFNLTDVSSLGAISTLTELNLFSCIALTTVSGLKECVSLKDLNLAGCTSLVSIEGLEQIPTLTTLCLWRTRITDITCLGKSQSLSKLDISHSDVRDITALGKIKTLRSLKMGELPITEISCLRDSPLTHIDLWGCTMFNDMASLKTMKRLKTCVLGHTLVNDISCLPFASMW